VRRTCRECLTLSCGCRQPQNGGNDIAVRGNISIKGNPANNIDTTKTDSSCTEVSPQASLIIGGMSQKKMINLVRITKMQREYLTGLPYLDWDSTEPGASSQLNTLCWVHDERIVQRVIDGHVAVIGHHSQEETFSGCQYEEKA
jgi:hypothetical protein